MKILLIAHACGPNRGSEPGTAWNLAWELSADHEVWVITHPQHAEEIDAYLRAHPRPRMQFDYVNLNPKWDTWKPKRGERGLKLHYILWQHAAAKRARQLCAQAKIDVAHHVTLGTINAPPVLHKLPVPVVWGPLGGGQVAPAAFNEYFPGHVTAERTRRLMAKLLPLTPALRRMARKSAIALAKNMETLDLLKRAGAIRSQFLLDCGLPPNYIKESIPPKSHDGALQLLAAGRMEQRKSPRLAIEAIAAARDVNVRLTFVGDGPELEPSKHLAASLNLGEDRVRFLGKVPYQQMKDLYRDSHALLFTALRDSSGCVVLEAMAHGLPIILLNHQGVACYVPDEAGVKVAVTNPKEVIEALANAIRTIAGSMPAQREAMANAALDAARRETWDQRAKLIAGWYQEIANSSR
jgi:glycosyltransferase involved in cell wall biosynthesis